MKRCAQEKIMLYFNGLGLPRSFLKNMLLWQPSSPLAQRLIFKDKIHIFAIHHAA